MSIKLIVTDLDGTFLNSNHVTIPQENINSFKNAHEMGIKVAIASGRTKILTDYLTEQLPFLDYLVTSNGAVAYDLKTGNEICSTLISAEQSAKIFDILDEYGLCYEIYFDGDCYMNSKSYKMFTPDNVSPHIYALLKDFIKEVPDLSALLNGKGMEKLNILSLSANERKEIEKRVLQLGDFSFASSFPMQEGRNGNLEITHKNSNKGYAVKSLAESLNINKENIMCFGDGENDCTMLEFADYSFAMANGSDYAKNSAKFITDTNDNCGVAKAIDKYVLDMRNFKGAIFDLDGTLFDSMGIWKDVDLAFFNKRGIEMPEDYQECIKDMHFRPMAEYTKERFNLSDDIHDIMDEWCALCFEEYEKNIALKCGAQEFLKMLKKMGIKIAFATANTKELSEVCLKSNAIFDLFDANAYLFEAGTNKNEPDIYLLACKRMGLNPTECIVFEDILPAIKGAKKGGFTVCGVYDAFSEKDTPEIKKNADYYIKSFSELLYK